MPASGASKPSKPFSARVYPIYTFMPMKRVAERNWPAVDRFSALLQGILLAAAANQEFEQLVGAVEGWCEKLH